MLDENYQESLGGPGEFLKPYHLSPNGREVGKRDNKWIERRQKRLGEGESAVWQVFLEEEGSKGSGHGFQHSRQTGLKSVCLGLFLHSTV